MFPVVCPGCLTQFALGLMRCPRCQQVAPQYAAVVKEEKGMPKITVAAGPSNADAKPGEVGYIERAEHKAAEALAEAKAEVHAAEAWVEKPIAHLREAAKDRGLPATGSKADLAARLTEHEAAQATAADAPEPPAAEEVSA